MNQKTFDEAIRDLHAFIDDRTALALVNISLGGNIRGSSRVFDEGWRTGFKRAVAEMQRVSEKKLDILELRTGSAGFVRLYKNGERISPKNVTILVAEIPAENKEE